MNSDQRKIGCCNLIIWDFLLIMWTVSDYYLPHEIHLLYRLLIALVIAILFIGLCYVPYLRYILHIVAGLLWACLAWYMIERLNWSLLNEDIVWRRGIQIALGVAFVSLHIVSYGGIGRGFVFHRKKKRYQNLEIDSESIVDTEYITDLESYITQFMTLYQNISDRNHEQFQELLSQNINFVDRNKIVDRFKESDGLMAELMKKIDNINEIIRTSEDEYILNYCSRLKNEMREILEIESDIARILNLAKDTNTKESYNTQKESAADNSFDPFAGCHDMESLTKRYKNLVKQFHPDVANGDTEQLQWLNSRYEELRNQMAD